MEYKNKIVTVTRIWEKCLGPRQHKITSNKIIVGRYLSCIVDVYNTNICYVHRASYIIDYIKIILSFSVYQYSIVYMLLKIYCHTAFQISL
jgi:hypothetical protein